MEDKYSLVGVDGNIFTIMAYTAYALRQSGHADKVQCMYDRAMASGDYSVAIQVCQKYIDIANEEGK